MAKERTEKVVYAIREESGDPIAGKLVLKETFEDGDTTPYKVTFAIQPRYGAGADSEDSA